MNMSVGIKKMNSGLNHYSSKQDQLEQENVTTGKEQAS